MHHTIERVSSVKVEMNHFRYFTYLAESDDLAADGRYSRRIRRIQIGIRRSKNFI